MTHVRLTDLAPFTVAPAFAICTMAIWLLNKLPAVRLQKLLGADLLRIANKSACITAHTLRWADFAWINQRLREHVAQWLGADVLLAAAILDRARAGGRVVKTEVVAASADRLRLWRGLKPSLPLVLKLAFGGDNGELPCVMAPQCRAQDWRDDEDQPPEVPGEVDHRIHSIILPHRLRQHQSARRRQPCRACPRRPA